MCRTCDVRPDKLLFLPLAMTGYRIWQALQVID